MEQVTKGKTILIGWHVLHTMLFMSFALSAMYDTLVFFLILFCLLDAAPSIKMGKITDGAQLLKPVTQFCLVLLDAGVLNTLVHTYQEPCYASRYTLISCGTALTCFL